MEITASLLQTVAAGQNALFTGTIMRGKNCCSIVHSDGSGLINLKGITNQCRAKFKLTFGANVGLPTGAAIEPITIAVAINGEAVSASTMISSPTATESYNNISTSIYLDVPAGCCYTISIKNIGANDVNIQNANLIVERVA